MSVRIKRSNKDTWTCDTGLLIKIFRKWQREKDEAFTHGYTVSNYIIKDDNKFIEKFLSKSI